MYDPIGPRTEVVDLAGRLLIAAQLSSEGRRVGRWAAVSREFGCVCPDQVIGVHLNLLPGSAAAEEPDSDELAALSPAERGRHTGLVGTESAVGRRDSQGYADIQSTRPQTLVYGLTDSSVGQLAWTAEKFQEWTDSRGPP